MYVFKCMLHFQHFWSFKYCQTVFSFGTTLPPLTTLIMLRINAAVTVAHCIMPQISCLGWTFSGCVRQRKVTKLFKT